MALQEAVTALAILVLIVLVADAGKMVSKWLKRRKKK
jgi:uncharacterized protein YoxC